MDTISPKDGALIQKIFYDDLAIKIIAIKEYWNSPERGYIDSNEAFDIVLEMLKD